MISGEMFTSETTALTPTLYRLCMSILHKEQDAQDAVQQGLCKAWGMKERIHPESFRPYLTRIIINECRNIQRHRQRVMPVEAVEILEKAYLPEETGLKAAIDVLPETLRTPLLLFYMENYSEREIAQSLNISLVAVKNRLFRARQKLKVALKGKEVDAACEN